MIKIRNITSHTLRGLKLIIVFLGVWIAPAWMLRYFYSDILYITTQNAELLGWASWAVYIYLYLKVQQEDIDENVRIALEEEEKRSR
ncbi:MAG: hypothetical protein UV68_C0041G0007 [Candidatus Collierbacteria bacterium GW2011_GWC2_43_12]|uniref:Uncharacterized protein n=1 Tax=Candidatus Collierbacteria bacterium GW2011_GWC2_43_12 TaxID=1618390 RepID=A0A0G1D422_9BACT|nr:MAG: hypothetical protein UV68_C0041G0007 [Candidatus Collierbacteria bacterium GW2011_GWC2_43_12]